MASLAASVCSFFIELFTLRGKSAGPVSKTPSTEPPALGTIEEQVIAVFVDGVKVLGLPRSIGEIYGLLFISPNPLSLDDLVERLGISKGSASQGLKTLRSLGAVREASGEGLTGRRTHYEAATELKRLVGGFIREQIRPHLESGRSKVANLQPAIDELDDKELRQFAQERAERLDQWMKNAGKVLPILQKLLGQ